MGENGWPEWSFPDLPLHALLPGADLHFHPFTGMNCNCGFAKFCEFSSQLLNLEDPSCRLENHLRSDPPQPPMLHEPRSSPEAWSFWETLPSCFSRSSDCADKFRAASAFRSWWGGLITEKRPREEAEKREGEGDASG